MLRIGQVAPDFLQDTVLDEIRCCAWLDHASDLHGWRPGPHLAGAIGDGRNFPAGLKTMSPDLRYMKI